MRRSIRRQWCRQGLAVLVLAACCSPEVVAYPNFYEKGSDVFSLKTIKDFKAQVSNSSFLWMLELYREGCGFCALLEKEYDKVATELKHVVYFGAIDVEQHRHLAQAAQKKYSFQVEGVPTVVFLSPDSSVAQVYNGERTAKAIKSGAYQAMPSFVKTVSSGNLDSWLSKGSAGVRQAVLFSAKDAVTPLLKAISSSYRGRIDFAQVATDLQGSSGRVLAERYGLERLPTLVVLRREADDFEGEKWLSEKFPGGGFVSLTWADGEKPSFRRMEGWLMGYARAPRAAPAKRRRGVAAGEL